MEVTGLPAIAPEARLLLTHGADAEPLAVLHPVELAARQPRARTPLHFGPTLAPGVVLHAFVGVRQDQGLPALLEQLDPDRTIVFAPLELWRLSHRSKAQGDTSDQSDDRFCS